MLTLSVHFCPFWYGCYYPKNFTKSFFTNKSFLPTNFFGARKCFKKIFQDKTFVTNIKKKSPKKSSAPKFIYLPKTLSSPKTQIVTKLKTQNVTTQNSNCDKPQKILILTTKFLTKLIRSLL